MRQLFSRQLFYTVFQQPQVLVALIVIVFLPLLFVYTANLFLDAGRANYVATVESAVASIHDALALTIAGDRYQPAAYEEMVLRTVARNHDMISLELVVPEVAGLRVAHSSQPGRRDQLYERDLLLARATIEVNQTLHEVVVDEAGSQIQSVRLVRDQSGTQFYIISTYSLNNLEAAFVKNLWSIYPVLLVIYVIVLVIAIWHVHAISYRDLFTYTYDTLRSRRQFTQMIAHELREPLTVARGYASMMLENNTLSQKDRAELEQIKHATERIASSIADIVDVAKIQAGTTQLVIAPVDIGEVTVAVLNDVRPRLNDIPITLVQSGRLAGAVVKSDEQAITQVIRRLVEHSIDNLVAGTIEIDINARRTTCDIHIKIRGKGPAMHDARKTFAPFFATPGSKTHETLVAGLSAWIARQYIDTIGARVNVESIKDVGVDIVVSVPTSYHQHTAS